MCFADANKFVTSANIRLAIGGLYRLCIGKWDGTKFVIRWESADLTGVNGWNNTELSGLKLKVNTGEQMAIKCLPSSTASIYFGDPRAPNNRFQQFSTTVNGRAEANLGSYFCIWFELKDIDLIPVESNAIFNLSKSVSKIVNDFSQNGYTGLESVLGQAIVSSDSTAGEGYAINKIDLTTSYSL